MTVKNEALEKEVSDLKEKNGSLEAKFETIENNIEDFKMEIGKKFKDRIEQEEVVVEDEMENGSLSLNTLTSCKKCDFIGKTEGGLKTHLTTKHKTVSLRGYTKIYK